MNVTDRGFFRVAMSAKSLSTCPQAAVGACVRRPNGTWAIGFNGAPNPLPTCLEVGCGDDDSGHNGRHAHAEERLIGIAACYGMALQGAILYVTQSPCVRCARLILLSGIARVVCPDDGGPGLALLREAGIEITDSGEGEE